MSSRECSATEELTAGTIALCLTTRYVGRFLEHHAEIDSTNRRGVELARQGAPSGAVILADCQTAGKGRLGRRWLAPARSSLLVSVVLRPEILATQAQRATMVCSLAMVEAVRQVTGLEPGIKWPNDLLLGDNKLGGILTELGLKGAALDYAVVGIGINVNVDVSTILAATQADGAVTPPASLSDALGHPVSRLELAVAFLNLLEPYLDAMAEGWSPHSAWQEHLVTLGKHVDVGTGDEVIHGVAEGVDADGALLVREASGVLRRIVVGDVTLRGHVVGKGPSSG